MQTKQIPLAKLMPAPWNANRVPEDTLEKIRHSIATFGVVENLVVRPAAGDDDRFEVLSGNHRLRIFHELGMHAATCVIVKVDDARARLLAQTLNRTRGEDDPKAYAELIREVLADLPSGDITALLPETEKSLQRVLATLNVIPPAGEGDDDLPELPAEPESQLGEVYDLGPHRLACGDSTDPAVLDALLGGALADLVITDPPYGVNYQGGAQGFGSGQGAERKRRVRRIDGDKNADLYAASLPLIRERMRLDAALYCWYSDSRTEPVFDALEDAGFHRRSVVVWAKDVPTGSLIAHYIPRHEPMVYASRGDKAPRWFGPTNEVTIWEFPKPRVNDLHPTQKPVAIYERIIRNSSQEGELVLDPFAGSGTTLVACDRMGRRAALVEADPGFCDVIRRRYEALTGGS